MVKDGSRLVGHEVTFGQTAYHGSGTAVVKDGIRTELVTNTEAVLSQVLVAVERKEEGNGKSGSGDGTGAIYGSSAQQKAEAVKETFYVYGNGLVSEESKDRGYLLYHYDHLGSTSLLTDGNGTVKRKYAYGPYGELVSGDRQGIRFLYNGQYGVETDGNGLYYMRARYYNESVKRFINQDVLAGSAADSPSLNRYAYVQGNPVSLTDPFGLSPSLAFSTIGHSLLGLVGFIVPGVGELADVVNAAWYFAEGDTLNGWLSLGSALPGIGSAAGQGIKLAFGNGSRAASMAKLVKDGSRLVGHAVTFGQTAYHGSGTAVEMYDKYYVQGLKPGADTVLEAGSLVLDVVTCVITGKSLVSDVQSAVQSVRVAGREMSGFFREKFGRPGAVGSKTGQPVLRMNLQFFAKKVGNESVNKYQKAGIWERLTNKKVNVNKLKANPLDEFSNPKIGPCESAVSKYIMEINTTGKLSNPIEVQKLTSGGYEIVNGHHRWLAAIKAGLEKVPIKIKNYNN